MVRSTAVLLVRGGCVLAATMLATHSHAQATTPGDAGATGQTVAGDAAPDRAAAYYHFSLAHLYGEMATTYGRPEYATRAVEEYKLALNADPKSRFLNNGLAELYFKTGRVRDAVMSAQDQLKIDPNNLEAHKLLGRIYLRSLGDVQANSPSEKVLELAIAEYTKIVELEPKDVESWLLLGQLHSLNHSTLKAEQAFKSAQAIDPNSEEVVLNMARLYRESGDLQRAVQVLSSLPEADRTSKIDMELGGTYDQLKDNKKAILAYQQSVDLEPDNLDAERGLGQALLNDNRLDDALKIYQDISSSDPQDPQAYVRISEIERRQGNYDQSLVTLKKAKALLPESLEISLNEALLYDALGRYDDATALLEKVVAQTVHSEGQYSEGEKNNRAIFLDRLANIYHEQNKTKEAVDTYKKMVELGGEFAVRGYEGQVDIYRDAKMYSEATAVAKEAVEKMPKERGLKLMLAGQLADTGKPDEGISMTRALLTGAPDDRDVYLKLVEIYSRLRRWKEATEELDKAEPLATRPDDKNFIAFMRASIAERQKHYDAAEEEFKKILEADPNDSKTLNYYGYMLADRGVKLTDALDLLQKAVKLDPQNGAFLDSLGWTYFKLGQYKLAEENLSKAIERMGSDPTVHDHLGELYEKTGRLKLAAGQWEQSLTEYERSVPADAEPSEVSKVQKKLETARTKLAKQDSK
jgi:tetratricopeptide (TPR) repeat protein